MSQFYEIDTNNGKKVVFSPTGEPADAYAGIEVKLINDLPELVAIINKEYATSLLHYQSPEKIDIQRLLIRCVTTYLKTKEII